MRRLRKLDNALQIISEAISKPETYGSVRRDQIKYVDNSTFTWTSDYSLLTGRLRRRPSVPMDATVEDCQRDYDEMVAMVEEFYANN